MILLTEQDPLVRATLEDMLEHLGYGSISADCPETACEVLERHDRELTGVIVDSQFLGQLVNGAHKAFRDSLVRLPVVVTGLLPRLNTAIPPDSRYVFLFKPITIEGLASVLKTLEVARCSSKADTR